MAPLYTIARGPGFGAELIPSREKLDGLGRYVNIRIAGGEGVVVGEDHGFGAVVAEGGFVVAADDGEVVEDVGGKCNSALEARLCPRVV